MATEKEMRECRPQPLSMGTARFKLSEESKQYNEYKELTNSSGLLKSIYLGSTCPKVTTADENCYLQTRYNSMLLNSIRLSNSGKMLDVRQILEIVSNDSVAIPIAHQSSVQYVYYVYT